jgi:hypothetical protein
VACRQQMKNAASTIEVIDDAIISHKNAIGIDSFHSMMGMLDERHTKAVDILIRFSFGDQQGA